MKNITKMILGLPMAAMFLTAALAGPSAKSIPFKGSVQAQEAYEFDFPIMYVEASGSGTATHLGRFTVTYGFTVNLLTGEGIGTGHQFVAANGDILFTDSIGSGGPSETPNINHVVEWHTITGGTGRFAGATGTFRLERLVSVITGFSSGSFEGTIVLKKKN